MHGWFFHVVSFGIVGAAGMVIDFGITWLLREKCGMDGYVANSIGFLAAVCNNYLLNKYWTYGERSGITMKQLLSFALVSCIGLSLNSVWLYVLHRWLKVHFYWAKLIATALVFIWNFAANNFITFH